MSAARTGGGLLARLQSFRARLLGGGLVLVFAMWSVDWLGGNTGPQHAGAATAGPQVGAYLIPDPPDRAEIDAFLADESAPTTVLVVRELRDPFLIPLESIPEMPEPAAPVSADPGDSEIAQRPIEKPDAKSAPSEPAFEQSHRLQGVVLGAEPYALVDGRPLRIGSRLGRYQLRQIERDRVVFRGPRGLIELRVNPPQLDARTNSAESFQVGGSPNR